MGGRDVSQVGDSLPKVSGLLEQHRAWRKLGIGSPSLQAPPPTYLCPPGAVAPPGEQPPGCSPEQAGHSWAEASSHPSLVILLGAGLLKVAPF